MNFRSSYDQGFLRVAACTMRTAIANPPQNAATVIEIVRQLDEQGVGLAVFPELCLTGYAIDDLLLTDVVPTGYQAAEMGGIQKGDTVVVFGAGPGSEALPGLQGVRNEERDEPGADERQAPVADGGIGGGLVVQIQDNADETGEIGDDARKVRREIHNVQ